MNRKILGLLASLALAGGCEFAKKTTYEGPIAQCRPVASACTENAECCSYGCGPLGRCVAGNHDGAVCSNTTDCGASVDTGTSMLCKSGHCSTAAICRDDADVCASYYQCCSSHCGTSGTCVPNNAPVVDIGPAIQVIPRNQPYTFTNASYDPDPTDSLAFGWTITPQLGSPVINLAAPAAIRPTITPNAAGVYIVQLDASDNWGLTRSAQFTLEVINTPPVIVGAADVAAASRNVPITITSSVSDPDGDAVTCWWTLIDPLGAPTTPVPSATCLGAVPLTFTPGAALTSEGVWTATLHATSAGNAEVTDSVAVNVVNDPPSIAAIDGVTVVAGVNTPRTYNLGFDPGSTPAAAMTATPFDRNGDAISTWTWEVLSYPGTSLVRTASLSGAATATASFTPDVVGDYQLRVTACDRPASCGQATVVATVYPYIRPLGAVVDAAWRKSDNRLIAVGTNAAAANQLWIVNPAADPATDAAVALGAAPLALSVRPDGQAAAVGEATARWQTVTLGGTPTASTLFNGPFDPTGVVQYDANRAFTIRSGAASPVYDLNLSAGTYSLAACSNCTLAGNRAVTDGTTLWMLDSSSHALSRFSVNNGNGTLTRDALGTAPTTATDLWRSSDPQYLFLPGTNGILVATTFFATGSLPLGTTHADSSLTGASLVGLAATGTTVTPFGSGFAAGAPIALPHWGLSGADRSLTSRFVFVSNDGTKAHVVVNTNDVTDEWGLYSCTLPCVLP